MAVEYIDSPTGVIGLGEGVGLETITPQRRRRVRRGDRGIFPVTPTGAESYEDPSFAPQRGFQQAYGAVPNVFERYAGLPGGARAGPIPGSGFEDVIFRPLPTDDVVEDDNDLEEELRRQTLDIDPYGDYYETQFDRSSPNYNPQAVADRDQQVAMVEEMQRANISFIDQIKVDFLDAQYRASGGTKGQSRASSLSMAQVTGGDPFATIQEGSDQGYVEGKGGKPGTVGDRFFADTHGFGGIMDPITGGRPVGATIGGTTDAGTLTGLGFGPSELSVQFDNKPATSAKAGEIAEFPQGRPNTTLADLQRSIQLEASPTELPTEGEYSTAGPPSVLSPSGFFTGAGSAPIVGSTPELGSRISRLQEIQQERAALQAQSDAADGVPDFDVGQPGFDVPEGAGEAAGLGADFDFGAALGFNRGGNVSFMGMKK